MTSIPLRLAEAQAPRYTSYPTAPHFGPAVDGAAYRAWLEALPAETPLSLYLHVPFCHQLCWYCGCHTGIAKDYLRIAAYVGLLRREIDLLAGVLGEGRPVTRLHWGGGTPSILSPEDFTAVMGQLRGRFAFQPGAELAIEIDPRHLDAEKGRLRCNFQGYTTDQAEVLLGLGVSAIGTLPQGYAQNDKDAVGYAKALDAGRLPVVRGIALTSEDRLRRDVIQALMCRFAVDLRAEAVMHGRPGFDFSASLERLMPLAAEGLVTLQGSKVTVTDEGRRAVRLIASCFDAYLVAGARYSRAV